MGNIIPLSRPSVLVFLTTLPRIVRILVIVDGGFNQSHRPSARDTKRPLALIRLLPWELTPLSFVKPRPVFARRKAEREYARVCFP